MEFGRAVVATLCFAALAALPAWADDPKAQAQAHFKEGQAFYEAGDFAAALGAFESAYAAVPAPALFFNIAQCHRKLNQHDRAVSALENFLSLQKSIPANIRTDAEAQLAEEKQLLAAEQEAAAVEPATAPAPEPAHVAPPPEEPPAEAVDDAPLWTNPIVIGAAAGTALVAVAAGALVVYSLRPGPTPPSTSLGTVDLR